MIKQFTKKDAKIVKQILDVEFITHLIATELSWHAKNAEEKKDRKALKIAAIYFGGKK